MSVIYKVQIKASGGNANAELINIDIPTNWSVASKERNIITSLDRMIDGDYKICKFDHENAMVCVKRKKGCFPSLCLII